MVRNKRPCGGSSRYRLQNRSFHLHISSGVEKFAHRIVNFIALDEYFFNTFVYDQIDVTLAIAQFGVFKCVIHDTVFYFDDGEWP